MTMTLLDVVAVFFAVALGVWSVPAMLVAVLMLVVHFGRDDGR